MPETIHVELVKVFRIAWWCPHCWRRGELLAARRTEPYHIQAAADNLHFWSPTNCPRQRVNVEFNTRRELRIPKARLITMPNGVGIN